VRESDTLARFGGDEFTLIQTRGDLHGASVLADKIIAALAQPFLIDGQVMRITTSIGIAIYPEQGTAPGALMEHADIALYRAKAEGRNRAVVYAEAMRDDLLVRRARAGDRTLGPMEP